MKRSVILFLAIVLLHQQFLFVASSARKYVSECQQRHFDITFVIDSSKSVGSDNFIKVLQFIRDLSDAFVIGPQNTRVAAITYSTQANVQFPFTASTSNYALQQRLWRIAYNPGFTATHLALRMVSDLLLPSMRITENVKRLVLVITDGEAFLPNQEAYVRKQVQIEAQRLQRSGLIIHGVSVGQLSKNGTREIEGISTERIYFQATNFDTLKNIIKAIEMEFCLEPPKEKCQENREISNTPCRHGYSIQKSVRNFYYRRWKKCASEIITSLHNCDSWEICQQPVVTMEDRCLRNITNIRLQSSTWDYSTNECVSKSLMKNMSCVTDEQCSNKQGDIIFVMDSSASMSPEDWSKQIEFVVQLLHLLNIKSDGVRVGVITYSSKATIHLRIGQISEKLAIIEFLNNLDQDLGLTATGLALHKAGTLFAQTNDPTRAKMIVLLTDGGSNDDKIGNGFNVVTEAQTLKKLNITLLVIGVGHLIDNAELSQIASTPLTNHLYLVENFESLRLWMDRISKETCRTIDRKLSHCDLQETIEYESSTCLRGKRNMTSISYYKDIESSLCNVRLEEKEEQTCDFKCFDPWTNKMYAKNEHWISNCQDMFCSDNGTIVRNKIGCQINETSCATPNLFEAVKCFENEDCVCTSDYSIVLLK